ncbi:ABC transporter permease [Nocardioides marmoribigeumensis]|uniref:ABC-type transport system involved in multi-copper enzyme maturation permease subunit n=1 Tax=Nocardioides marmoribigeumensis TaxID=433649 RepID=A0ABU2C0H1_9ACTN|nr:ABC transporter permease [Nocardioides marmoribigeumensis]MDR7364141.1 ABC-type transport system involved in multi-copper enzyme maturation permease subunit [Nocardioides marmoribigeumensis]
MTSTSTTGSTVSLPEDRDAHVPLARLVKVEMRKMLDTRAGFWLLVVIALLTVAAIGLFAVFAPDQDRTFDSFLGGAATPQGFLLPVLGVLLVTSEWGQRAALATFTLVPVRARVVAAKVLAALVIGTAAVLVAVVVAALVTAVRGGSNAWDAAGTSVLDATWMFALLQALGILQGLAFGMLFLNSAAAIVVFFVVPIVSSVVFNLVPALQDVAPWVDLGSAQAEWGGGGPVGNQGPPTAEAWAQLGTAGLIWIVLPLVLGGLRILRSEVK